MDSLIRVAALYDWNIKTIIMDDKILREGKETANKRILGSMKWHIGAYDQDTGDCTLVRWPKKPNFVDQFDLFLNDNLSDKKGIKSDIYQRSFKVRYNVIIRADGNREFCGSKCFIAKASQQYLETHHIQPLSEAGVDTEKNVIVLCPYHHRYAH